MFARFDENPAMTLRVIKETKRYGRTDPRTDNVKTVYPLQTKFAGGIKIPGVSQYVLQYRFSISQYIVIRFLAYHCTPTGQMSKTCMGISCSLMPSVTKFSVPHRSS